jgi:amino acid permease
MTGAEKYVHTRADVSSEERGYRHDPRIDDAPYIEDDVHHNLHRGLKSRQVAMIAIGGAIGMPASSYL